MIDSDRIAAIEARCKAATPGPWKAEDDKKGTCIYDRNTWAKGLSPFAVIEPGEWRNAEFIAHAREDIPWLLMQIEDEKDDHKATIAMRDSMYAEKDAEITALSAEVKRLREAQRWIPVVERKPTSEDGDLVGELIVWNSLHGWAELMPYTFAADGYFPQYTHWMPLPGTEEIENET